MSKITIKWAELHNPLFLGGTNHQLKLDPTKRSGLQMVYDRKEKEMLVFFNNEVAIIPNTNIATMIPANVADVGHAFAVIPTVLPVGASTRANPVANQATQAAGLGLSVQDINPKAIKVNAQVVDPTRDPVFGGPGAGKIRD